MEKENLRQVLDFLNRNKLRASYKDVAAFLGLPARALAELLEPHRPEACWVVNEETGKPSGYSEAESDPDLRSRDIITDEDDLRAKMRLDKLAHRPRWAPGPAPTAAPSPARRRPAAAGAPAGWSRRSAQG